MNSDGGIIHKVRGTYERLGQSLGLNHDFSDMQVSVHLNLNLRPMLIRVVEIRP